MKKRMLVIGGIIVLVIVLAGAAFVGGRLLTGQGLPVQVSSGGLRMALGGPGGKVPIQFDEQPAKELPQTPADVRGAFDHRKDNSIFVGTGKVTFTAQKDQSGQVQTSSSHSGPTVEVVVTPQTIVYKDVTLQQYNGQPPPDGKVQQVVEPGTLDDIGTSSLITAWGKKTGDRIVADVLVYTPPPVLIKRP
jgi:hypothetical protein